MILEILGIVAGIVGTGVVETGRTHRGALEYAITSPFGDRKDPFKKGSRFHEGIDLGAPEGALVMPFQVGRVSFSGVYKGYGNLVVVEHGRGITSHYAHCSKIKAKVGSIVHPGSVLGYVGSSGRSTGAHLHFELRLHGRPVNPKWVLEHLNS